MTRVSPRFASRLLWRPRFVPAAALALAVSALACDSGGTPTPPGQPPGPSVVVPHVDKPAGQTEFVTEDQIAPTKNQLSGNADAAASAEGARGGTAGAAPGNPTASPAPSAPNAKAADDAALPTAPGGRVADVEEADIYKVVGNRLYYFNTYKGFIIYDVANPKAPARISRLPLFGYPVEMFVEGNTVHALLRDALYLTQVNGKTEFARHNVSQLVTIDISNPAQPQILKTIDITGQLREGVSRKIDDTIYVVSYWSRGYWWGWAYDANSQDRQDQAFVYSFDVADPKNPKKVQELQIFNGGAVNYYDKTNGASFSRNFQGISISATSNALMTVENWYINSSGGYVAGRCGYYNSDQQSVVSIIDISDPTGKIRKHTSFETAGALTDQFKQTYVHDPKTGKGTYFGIFARRGWSSGNCNSQQIVQNTIEAWDVSTAAAVRSDALDFGKPNERVRGSAFDTDRQVAYAITAVQTDPLYAISIANPADLRIRSQINDLSGDMTVFRLVGDKKFLVGVGNDNSSTCKGLVDMPAQNPMTAPGKPAPAPRASNNIAISIIDVQNLDAIALVQRQCVTVENAAWVGSEVTEDLDQAHKMLGMHADGNTNVITVPVSYYKRHEDNDWRWQGHETAVGIMSWDLTRYAPGKPATEQKVIQNHGTFIHPNGEVRRSVLFSHETSKERLMANLSDTHISIANLQDLGKPKLESIVEIAPYLHELFRFGDHIVEQVQPRTAASWNSQQGRVEFRIKPAGGDIDGVTPVAMFAVGQVERAVKHGNQLVVFRYEQAEYDYSNYRVEPKLIREAKSEAIVFDLSDPRNPKRVGRVNIPQESFPYYRFYCGGFWSGFWFDNFWGHYYGSSSWVDTAAGLVMTKQSYTKDGKLERKLQFLDLRATPKLVEQPLSFDDKTYPSGLTVDAVDGRGFYLGVRKYDGEVKRENGTVFHKWKDYASRYELNGARWVEVASLNIPGRLVQSFLNAEGERHLLASDTVSWWIPAKDTSQSARYATWTRVSLLREISVNGRRVAERLGEPQVFRDLQLASLVADGDKLYVNGKKGYGYFHGGGYYGGDVASPGIAVGGKAGGGTSQVEDQSDRLLVFDMAQKSLALIHDAPTKMYNVSLMGAQKGRLFANLAGDGILVFDVSNPAAPKGQHFERTLGYATHVDIAGEDVYVGSGFFGTRHLDLRKASSLATIE